MNPADQRKAGNTPYSSAFVGSISAPLEIVGFRWNLAPRRLTKMTRAVLGVIVPVTADCATDEPGADQWQAGHMRLSGVFLGSISARPGITSTLYVPANEMT